jgi:acyl-CoA thioester hydrolase
VTPLEPAAGQSVYRHLFAVEPADVDANGHVNNIVYLGWAQDLATRHWALRFRSEESEPYGWIVLRHEIDYRRPLLPGEVGHGQTWVGAAKGPRFLRYVRIDGPDGQPCAQVISTWCLIDSKTRRPLRVPLWVVDRFEVPLTKF